MLRRKLLLPLLIYALYGCAALIVTYPLVTVLATDFAGHPFGDSYEYARFIWWIPHALQHGLPLFDQPLLGYPAGLSGAYLWALPLQSFPAWLFALALPLPAAFNLALLLTLALNGWSLCWLVRRLTDSLPAALLAGMLFMTYPAFQGHLAAGHSGLLTLYPAVFYTGTLLALLNRADNPRPRAFFVPALWFMVSAWGSILLGIYLLLPVTLLLLAGAVLRRRWRSARRVLLAAGMGTLLAGLFVLPAAADILNAPAQVRERDSLRYSADLLTVIAPSFMNPLYAGLDYSHRLLGAEPFEQAGYIGIAGGLLAAVGVWRRRAARGWLLLALAAWVLSLGAVLRVNGQTVLVTSGAYTTPLLLPWALLERLPLLSLSRTPVRFNFTLGLALAIMAGYGAAGLFHARRGISASHESSVGAQDIVPARVPARVPAQQVGRRWGHPARTVLLLALLAVVLFDQQLFWGLPTVRGVVPAPVAALAGREDVRAVLDLPVEHPLAHKDGMWLQTGHQRPMIGGQITRRTPVDPAKLALLQTLDLALLDAAGVDVVILHKQWAQDSLAAHTRAVLGMPFYEDDLIAVFAVPAPDTPLQPLLLSAGDSTYLFTPDARWLLLALNGTAAGDVALLLDGAVVGRAAMQPGGAQTFPLYIEPGYHTLTLEPPPCSPALVATLECPPLPASIAVTFAAQPTTPAAASVMLDGRVTLRAGTLAPGDAAGREVVVWLWWQAESSLLDSAVRFVHLLDADGTLVAQSDVPLGAIPAGEGRAEVVRLALPNDLPPGEYTLYAGWYTYPDLMRLTTAEGADRIYLGTMTLDAP